VYNTSSLALPTMSSIIAGSTAIASCWVKSVVFVWAETRIGENIKRKVDIPITPTLYVFLIILFIDQWS
jgi:hypothetical protein